MIRKNIQLIGIVIFCILQPAFCGQVYFCDFDNGSCPNGAISLTSVTLVDSQILQGNQYRLTDVTSIITPTSNGEICEIPYIQGSFEYNHCYLVTPNYQCKTVGGATANCKLGKFLLGRTLGAPINSKATSSEILLPEIGNYEMNFYILMFTNTTDLTADGDYIQISLYYSSDLTTSFKSEKYDYSNLGKPNKWNKKSFNFVASETKIKLVVEFVRLTSGSKYGFFGFDHVEINDMNSGSQTTNLNQEISTKSTTITKDSTITIQQTTTTTAEPTTTATTATTTTTTVPTTTTTTTVPPTTTTIQTTTTTTTRTVPTTTTTVPPTTTTVPPTTTTTTTTVPPTTTTTTTTVPTTTTTTTTTVPPTTTTTTVPTTTTTIQTTTTTTTTRTVPTTTLTTTVQTTTTTTTPTISTNTTVPTTTKTTQKVSTTTTNTTSVDTTKFTESSTLLLTTKKNQTNLTPIVLISIIVGASVSSVAIGFLSFKIYKNLKIKNKVIQVSFKLEGI